MSRKFIQISFFILLLTGLVLGLAIKDGALASALQAEPNAKIESMLLDKFATDGKADFIISFTEKADLSAAYSMDWEARGHYVYDTLTATAQRVQAQSKSTLDGYGFSYKTFIAGNQLYVFGGNVDAANAVAALPEVSLVRATRVWQIDPVTTATSAVFTANWPGALLAEKAETTVLAPTEFSWGIVDTKANEFWGAYGVEGAGVVVANIDTGVDYTHIALADNYKCAGDPSNPACWEDPTNNCPGAEPCDAWPGIYHGTHTMGTMVGSNDPALPWQVGMSPDSQWIACLGCPSGGCPDINLNTCADWILAPGGDSNNRPNVVNNSWGGGGGSTFYLEQVQSWVAAGVFPAFSAGNNYSCNSLGSPGDYQESFGSAAHQSNRTIAGFSSKGPSYFGDDPYTKPNISAPGQDIMSAMPGDAWQLMSGTSMASPHTSGAVALLWACNPSLIGQIDQTFQILQDNSDPAPAGDCGAPPDGEGNYTFGYGYLDVFAAGALWCGETGTINGHVYDAVSAAPIAGATVHGVGEFGGGPTAETDATGYFTMDATVGTYDVTASHPHYLAATETGVVVITDTVTTVDFDLTPRGWVYGHVTDFDNGTPIVEATVSADDGQTTITDFNGYYEIYLDPGLHTITAVAPDYAEETANVTIVSGAGVQQDFALQAAVVFIPSPIDVSVPLGSTFVLPATIGNRMPTAYDFEFKEKDGGYNPEQKISIPAFTGEIEKNAAPASTGPAPTGLTPQPSTNQSGILEGPQAYGVDANMAQYYTWPDIELPGTWNLINAVPGTAFFGGDFLNGDFSTEYALDYNSNSLYGIDTTTGALTLIGPASPGGGESWTGLTGAADGTMYASATTCGSSTLYTIDVDTAALTTVGPITNGSCIIDIAINADGDLYGVDIVADTLVKIDPNTGAGTIIGATGVDANYAQDLTFDQSTGILYWASWNWVVGGGELRIIDTTTGNSVSVGGFPGGAEVDAFALPTSGASDVLWLSETPISGTVPADGELPVTVNFDASPAAGVTQPGTYLATLTLKGVPKVDVPVTMFVEAPADWGRVHGTVTGLGYCDQNPAPLEGATVDIVGAATLTTDELGQFATWLEQGTYDVVVTADGHLAATGTVTVIAQGDVTADFDLRWDQPCITGTPPTMEVTLDMGATQTEQLTLTNNGAGMGTFEMSDHETGYTPMRQNFLPPAQRPANPDTTPSSAGRDPNAKTITPSELNNAIAELTGEPAFAMDVYPGYNLVSFANDTPGTWDIIANEPGSAFFGGDFINADFETLYVLDYYTNLLSGINTTTGAVTTIGTSNPGGGETWTGMTGATDGTMYAVASSCGSRSTLFTVDLTSGALTTIGDITNGTCVIDIAATPEGLIFGVDIVNDNLLSINPATGAGTIIGYIGFNANYAQGMDYEETTGTLYLAAYSFSGELRIADPATGNTTVVGAFPGGAEVDALGFATGGGGDALWLTENPLSGVIGGTANGQRNGVESLSGSYVVFDPSVCGDTSYTPGADQTFCFRAESFTGDYGYVYNLWQKFPSDWVINNVSVFGTPTCDTGSYGTFSWSYQDGPNEVNIYHPRYQSNVDHCVAYYSFDVTVGAGGGDALESWYWAGDNYGAQPYHPCSSDVYTPSGEEPCDESVNPQAAIPSSGPIDNTQIVDVTFDAGMVPQPGTYTGEVKAATNDPVNPNITVAATMNVTAPADWGKLAGVVTGLGYCDADPAPLSGADVSIAGGLTVKTDATGSYLIWLQQGTYDVTVTADEHAIGTAQVVVFPGGETTFQNFDLRWLRPCLTVDPTSLTQTLNLGETAVQQLTITNSGAGDLNWKTSISGGDYTPSLVNDVLVVSWDVTGASAMETALTSLGLTYDDVSDMVFQSMTVDQLLEYSMVFYAGIPYGTSQNLVMAYLDAGGSLYISDNDLGYSQYSTPFYQVYLQATYNEDSGGNVLTGEDIMAGLTVDVTADPYPDGFTVGAEAVQIFTWDVAGDAGGDAIEREGYKAIYTAFDYQYISSADVAVDLMQNIVDYLAGAQVLWLYNDPTQGVVPADSETVVNVTFDATVVNLPGTYTADLKVKTNDPVNGTATLPATLTVAAPADWGKLAGTVTGLGYCDVNPAPLADAQVCIEGGNCLVTGEDGSYLTWLQEGTYNLTVTAEGHEVGTATVEVFGLGQITTQDFDLRWLQPCMSETPASLEATLDMGETATFPIVLTNDGAAASNFVVSDKDMGYTPVKVAHKTMEWNGIYSTNAQAFTAQPSAPSHMTQADVLLIEDSPAWGSPAITTILDTNEIAYDLINSSQISGWDFSAYRMIIIPSVQGQAYYNNFNANLSMFEEFVDGGGLMLMNIATQGETINLPFGGTSVYNAQGFNYIVDPEHPIFAGVPNPYSGNSASHTVLSELLPDDVLLVTTGEVPGGAPVMAERYMGGGLVVIGGQTFEFGWLYGQGAGTILTNMIPYYYNNFQGGGDAVWLTEEPISGTVGINGGTQTINATFDAGMVTQPGTYLAEIRIKTDDPVTSKFIIPATLNVNGPPDWGQIEGVVTSLGYCDDNPMPLEGATVVIGDLTLTTDQFGHYSTWVPSGEMTVDVSAEEHLPASATVVVNPQEVTVQDFDLRFITPCVSVNPTALQVDVLVGQTRNTTLHLVNSGAGATDFVVSEIPSLPVGESRPIVTSGKTSVTIGDNIFGTNPNVVTGPKNQAVLPPKSINSTTITESLSQEIMTGNSVSCNAGGLHTDNHYLRAFDLASFDITADFAITSVDIGIEQAISGGGGTQPAEIRLYTLEGDFVWANMTLIASAPVEVANQNLTIINMPVEGVIPAGSILVVDFFTPNGQGAGNSLFVGSNNLGETAPTYLSAVDCGVPEPTPTGNIGFPGMNLVMNVTGDVGSQDIPWLSELPLTGTVDADSVFNITVSFDSMTYTVGTYMGTLKIKTGDMNNSTILVPVQMNVVSSLNFYLPLAKKP